MKSLIVLTAVITLLASMSGCSILGERSYNSPSSASPSLLGRLRLPRLWNHRQSQVGGLEECNNCNQGINQGIIEGTIVPDSYDSGYYSSNYDGQIIRGPYEQIVSGPIVTEPIRQESLYHPNAVGPIASSGPIANSGPIIDSGSAYSTKPTAYERIATPVASPELGQPHP